jgi:hypothetical protein
MAEETRFIAQQAIEVGFVCTPLSPQDNSNVPVLVGYLDPLTTQDLKSSGFPEG